MGSGGFFGFFLDLFFVVPVLLLVRAIYPSPLVFRIASILAGLYVLYGQAPRMLPFFIAFWLVVWALQKLAVASESWTEPTRVNLAIAAIVLVPLAPMLAWKLAPGTIVPWFNEVMARLLHAVASGVGFADALVGLVVPLGLSFATFRALDLLLKQHLGLLPALSLDRVLYYGLFPPILALGPISEYEEVRADKPLPRAPAPGDVAVGLVRTAWGTVKIFGIGLALERAAAVLWANGTASVPVAWLALLLYGLFFYANFSGYSEVAIGLSRMLGLRLKENFANPFLKTNPQAFWNAWHMSLTRWAQRYIFVPLGGMRAERQYVAIFAAIMVIALWHGLAPTMVVFGLFHASIVVGHRSLLDRRKKQGLPPPIETGWIGALKVLAVITYVSFSIPMLLLNSGEAMAFYGHMLLGTKL